MILDSCWKELEERASRRTDFAEPYVCRVPLTQTRSNLLAPRIVVFPSKVVPSGTTSPRGDEPVRTVLFPTKENRQNRANAGRDSAVQLRPCDHVNGAVSTRREGLSPPPTHVIDRNKTQGDIDPARAVPGGCWPSRTRSRSPRNAPKRARSPLPSAATLAQRSGGWK